MMISRFLKLFFIIDFVVVLFCLLSGQTTWLINTQVAFFSSLFVTIGSYYGYKKNISKRVETHVNDDDEYDELDKMDDKYDLYSPEVNDEQKEYTKEEIKEEIAKSKESLKKNNTKNLVSSAGAMASFYRLAGYIVLVVGFFYLNNNALLDVYSYLLGFLIVPISTLMISIINKTKQTVS